MPTHGAAMPKAAGGRYPSGEGGRRHAGGIHTEDEEHCWPRASGFGIRLSLHSLRLSGCWKTAVVQTIKWTCPLCPPIASRVPCLGFNSVTVTTPSGELMCVHRA